MDEKFEVLSTGKSEYVLVRTIQQPQVSVYICKSRCVGVAEGMGRSNVTNSTGQYGVSIVRYLNS